MAEVLIEGEEKESTKKIVESIADRVMNKAASGKKKEELRPVTPKEETNKQEVEQVTIPEIPSDLISSAPVIENDKDDLPEVEDTGTKEAFINLRTKFKSKLAALEAELKKTKEERNTGDITALRTELAETKKRLGAYSLTEDPDFKERYDKPIQLFYSQAVDVVKSLDGKPEVINRALSLPYKERIKFLEANVPHGTALILPLLAQMDVLHKYKNDALTNFEEEKKKLAQIKFEREKGYRNETLNQSFSAALKQLTESEKHPYLMKSKVDENWNKHVDQKLELASKAASSDDAFVRAETALKAVIANDYKFALDKAYGRIQELEKELNVRTRYSAGSGSTGGAATAASPSSNSKRPKNAAEVAALLTKGLR